MNVLLRRPGLTCALVIAACAPDARLDDEGERLARAALGPPVLTLLDPPTGAPAVPPNLSQLVLRAPAALSTEALRGSVRLSSSNVDAWSEVPCPGDGFCYLGRLVTRLVPDTSYTLETGGGLSFSDGRTVTSGLIGRFRTGALADRSAPTLTPLAVEEVAGCVRVRLHADEPVFVTLWLAAGDATTPRARGGPWTDLDAVLPPMELPGVVGVPMGGHIGLEIGAEAWDRSGNVSRAPPVRIQRPVSGPPLVITEVLSNPSGPETTQEFVEIRNLGDQPVPLGGLVLSDGAGADALPPVELAGRSFLLVVPAGYDPSAAGEVPPRPGTLVLRVDGRLGRDGLGNAGEAVSLRRATDGLVISRYGGWVDTGGTPGRSVHRLPHDACDVRAAWSVRAESPTPGW